MRHAQQYAPNTINEIVFGNDKSHTTINHLCEGKCCSPSDRSLSLLLHGSYGTGKSTLARMLPNAIEKGMTGSELGLDADYFECAYAGIGQKILERISLTLEKSAFANRSGRWYFILDEVDNITAAAMRSLRGLMNSKHAVFILTTNHTQKIDPSILDRCIPIEMNKPSQVQMFEAAKLIACQENLVLSEKQLQHAAACCNGSFRRLGDMIRIEAMRIA